MVLLVAAGQLVTGEMNVSNRGQVDTVAQKETYLSRFRGRLTAVWAARGDSARETTDRAGLKSFSGTGGGARPAAVVCLGAMGFCWSVECFWRRSPILSFRRAMGMRLTRISIRVRSPCA